MHNRRQFLAALAAAPLAAASQKTGDAGAEWRNRQSGMAYRRLGRTGFMISEVVMGGNRISPDNYDHVLLALDMGLNYLDTAPAYGRGASESGFGRVLKARKRDSFFLNTKVSLWDINRNRVYKEIFDSLPDAEQKKLRKEADEEIARSGAVEEDHFVNYFNGQRGELEEAALSNVMERKYGRRIDRGKNYKKLILESVEQSLERLGTDHLDILMCPHGASTAAEMLNFPETFEAFEILKKAGKVRHLGVSAHTDPAGIVKAAIQTGVYSMAMIAYNAVNHRFVKPALEQARQKHFGVIAMKVANPFYRRSGPVDDPKRLKLLEDAVRGSWSIPQKAYLFSLGNPNLTAVIAEMVDAKHVKDNLPLAGRGAAA